MSSMNQGNNWDLDGSVENESFSKYHFILCFTLKPKEHELLCEWLIHSKPKLLLGINKNVLMTS